MVYLLCRTLWKSIWPIQARLLRSSYVSFSNHTWRSFNRMNKFLCFQTFHWHCTLHDVAFKTVGRRGTLRTSPSSWWRTLTTDPCDLVAWYQQLQVTFDLLYTYNLSETIWAFLWWKWHFSRKWDYSRTSLTDVLSSIKTMHKDVVGFISFQNSAFE